MRETLEYVQNASYENLEIIVVDDGSTDISAQIVLEQKQHDNRIKLITKTNGGVVSSRNVGLMEAVGNYVCFMDQDDIVEPFMYEKLLAQMEEYQCEIGMCSSARLIDGEVKPLDIQEDAIYEGQSIAKSLLLPMIYNDFDVPVDYKRVQRENHIWVCIFSRTFLIDNNIVFRAYVDFEDDLLVKAEALSLAKCVCTISDIGYYWRIHRKSESHAHKNITDIWRRQDDEYRDLAKSLSNIGELNDINLNRRIIFCKQYIKAIINSTCPENCKSVSEISSYFEKSIYSREFGETITAIKYLKTNKMRWKVLLPLLRHKMTLACYGVEWLIESVQRKSVLNNFYEHLKGNR